MPSPESAHEKPRVKRGAFPTPKSEIERAPRFEPERAEPDDDTDDGSPEEPDTTGTGT